MAVLTKKKGSGTVTLSRKEYENLKKAAEELDTLKAILTYEEEKRAGKLKSFKDVRDLIHDLDR
ncbi:MAG: hypothetical protein HY203_10690 [Nitrospirae bacterium]|nr:hypothetical protein [Nitrospirota bacterium]